MRMKSEVWSVCWHQKDTSTVWYCPMQVISVWRIGSLVFLKIWQCFRGRLFVKPAKIGLTILSIVKSTRLSANVLIQH